MRRANVWFNRRRKGKGKMQTTTLRDARADQKSQGMSRAGKSVLVFGIYLIGMGVNFIAAPNLFLSMFGFPASNDVWIRVVGMLALLLAFYYIQAARLELGAFFQLTVYARASVIFFFGAFVALGYVQPTLVLFGAVDLLGAIWTALALRSK